MSALEEKEKKPKRKYVRKAKTVTPITPITPITPPEEPVAEEGSNECLICTEECKTALPCSHMIHSLCIAKSGQSTCSVCRTEVVFTQEEKEEFYRAKQDNEEEKRQRELNESLTLAQEINRQINEPVRPRQNVQVISVNGRRHRVEILNRDGALHADEMMLQLNALMVGLAGNTETNIITADRRVIDLYFVMIEMNTISANTGLNVGDLCRIIEMNL